ncbi:MAG: hypothetical protein ACTSUE_27335 [Promethearchaeota archaeon]
MSIKIIVEARDQPGELIKILQPLSDNGANIHGVFHDHIVSGDARTGSVPVEIMFTLNSMLDEGEVREKLDKIKDELTARNISVISISLSSVIKKHHVILTGHIFDTDIRDTILQISSTRAQVVGLKGSITSDDKTSTVMFTITYEDESIHEKLISKIEEICKEKELKYITS